MPPEPSLREIIDALAMERHPTAGWYSAHYSGSELLGRPKLSSIHYLLAGVEPMPRHKLDATEIWHFSMGAPAEFTVTGADETTLTTVLGTDLSAGQRPQLAVPAYLWQSCRSLGAWTLLGCTASPGFSQRSAVVIRAD